MPSDLSHSFLLAKSKAREVATQKDKDMLSGATAQPVKALTIEACWPKICGTHTKRWVHGVCL